MRYLLPILALALSLSSLPAHSQTREPTLLEETVYRLQMGSVDDVMFLVKRLNNPNATDRMGWPLLAIAAARTDKEALPIVKAMIEAGAKVDFGGGGSFYPIIYAVQNGNVEVAKYLLEQGADYRVTDGVGVRLVDFARQSGNKEMSRLIEDAIDRDINNLTKARSKSNLDELTYKVAYHACAEQYFGFYYKTKQDPIPESEQKQTLAKHHKIVSDSMSGLVAIFKIPADHVTNVYLESRKLIFNELENLVSNRWRRQKGVGQAGDMEARCEKIAQAWRKDHFDNYFMQ